MIKLIKQSENKSDCVLACIAMVSGITLAEVTEFYEKDIPDEGLNIHEELKLLNKLDIHYIQDVREYMYPNRVYMVTVPSKNNGNIATLHRIVIDNGFSVEGETRVLDPSTKAVYENIESIPWFIQTLEFPEVIG